MHRKVRLVVGGLLDKRLDTLLDTRIIIMHTP